MLKNCALTDHTAWASGGAVANYYGTVNFYHCILKRYSANTASWKYAAWNEAAIVRGGAIHTSDFMELSDCTFTRNSASDDGGALYNNGATVTLNRCALVANKAKSTGGALYAISGKTVLGECVLTRNFAEAGGGLFTQSGRLELND